MYTVDELKEFYNKNFIMCMILAISSQIIFFALIIVAY